MNNVASQYVFDCTNNKGIWEKEIFLGQKNEKVFLKEQNLKPRILEEFKRVEKRKNIRGMEWHEQKPQDYNVV